MRRDLSILAGLIFLSALALPAPAAEEGAEEPAAEAPAEPRPAEIAKSGSFTDDLEKLKAAVGLTEDQEKKIRELQEKLTKDLEKYDKDNEKKLATAREKIAAAKSDLDRKRNEEAVKAVEAGRERISEAYEKKYFAVLTSTQRGKWNGQILCAAVDKEFQSLNLTEEENKKIATLCENSGKLQPGPLSEPVDPKLLTSLYKQVYMSVLTPEQRQTYAKSKMPTAEPKNEGKKNKKKNK